MINPRIRKMWRENKKALHKGEDGWRRYVKDGHNGYMGATEYNRVAKSC